jgi:hypothetical protein
MNDYKEKQVIARLRGVPVFLVGRLVKTTEHNVSIYRNHWHITFDNGFGASIVEFTNRNYSVGEDYELCVKTASHTSNFKTIIGNDILRGTDVYIDKILTMIEVLSPCGQSFIWNQQRINECYY